MGEVQIFSKVDRLIYHYGDASVPPPYHRSYTLTLTPHQLKLVVDSYGDRVHAESRPVSPQLLQEMVALVASGQIRNCIQPERQRGCTGGTSESLKLFSAEQPIFSGSVYHCGGDEGDLCGELGQLSARLKAECDYFAHLH
jgi:hypothetical protein